MKKQILIGLSLALTMTTLFLGWLFSAQQGPTLGGDFTLNHNGSEWNFREHAKKVNLLYVGYAKCPDVCPMALSFTAQALRELNESELGKVQFIFISVDSKNDTPESVATYARQFNSSFIGLTGPADRIDATIKMFGASYMIEEDAKSYLGYSIAHTDRIFILNKKGRVVDSISNPRSAEEITQKIKENL